MNSFTIFCGRRARADVLKSLRDALDGTLDIAGRPGRWTSIRAATPHGTMKFTSLVSSGPGSKFDKLILGTCNFICNIDANQPGVRAALERRIASCRWIIGVVVDPEATEEDGHYAAIYAITEAADGVIFTGEGFVGRDGRMILADDGSSEVAR